MAAVPATLLSISLYAAVIFCGIMIFKKCTQNKLSPVLHFALWFLLIVRLALPFTAETGFHFVTLPRQGTVEMDAASAETGGEPLAALSGGTTAPGAAAQAAEKGEGAVLNQAPPQAAQQGSRQGQEAPPAVSSGSLPPAVILTAAWLAGAGVVALCMAGCCLRMRRRIRRSTVLPDARINKIFEACKKELGIRGGIRLRLCSALTTPALTVSPRPMLLLPLDLFSEDEEVLRYALLHELTHYRRGDHAVRLTVNILKAVWWFHPVVWLADRQIVMDMETACDNMVVRRMEKEEKRRYAATVLAMFSEDREARYVLGMALGNSKQVAEKRIRGMYMNRKTKRGVRLAALILTGMLGIACFTTACAPARAAETGQAAQPAEAEMPANELTAQEAETGTKQAAQDIPRVGGYRKTDTWQETFETGNITVVADADVLEFASGGIPDYESHPTLFTQEMADRVIKYFMGDAQLYEHGSRGTSEEEGVLDDGKFREMPPPDPSVADAGQCEQINVEATLADGSQASALVYNIELTHESFLNFTKESKQETGLSISREEAAALAVQTADALGISPAYVFGITASDEQSGEAPRYDVVLSRCPQPAVWYSHTNGSDTAYQAQNGGVTEFEGISPMYGPEVILVSVDDSGVVGFQWSAPDAPDITAGGNAQTAPFEDILQAFRDNIGSKTWAEPELSATLYVDQVVLTMQRVLKKDGSYRTQPVWEFVGGWNFGEYGSPEEKQMRKSRENAPDYGITSLLTVNATDGTVVDTVTHFMSPGLVPQNFGGWDAAGEAEVQAETGITEPEVQVEPAKGTAEVGSARAAAQAEPAESETNVRITAAAETVQAETGERAKFTFRIQNNMDATLENGVLKVQPLNGGEQLGKTFSLEPGETRIMTWETPLTENMTVHAAVYFMADGRETYAEAPPVGVDFPAEDA